MREVDIAASRSFGRSMKFFGVAFDFGRTLDQQKGQVDQEGRCLGFLVPSFPDSVVGVHLSYRGERWELAFHTSPWL